MTALTLLVTGAALLILQGVTFLVALKAGKHSVVDTAWASASPWPPWPRSSSH